MQTLAVDAAQADFGKYQLLRKLAQGGMAEIFLATQRGIQGFEKLVVLKRVLPDLSASDDFVTMFLDEARIAARLDHPNIVRIYDLGEVKGQYFIAMEYIAGEDLASVIQQCKRMKLPVPVEFAVEAVLGAAEALHFAHDLEDDQGNKLNLVHRDVSPSNIVYTWQGGVKLVDFGIARAESNVSKTESGHVKGKIQYLSPEQVRTEPIDGRSDIFALGIVLFELLTQKRLFQRDNTLQTMNAILKAEVPPPTSVRPDIPPELEAIVMKALHGDREQRYQAAGELAAELAMFLHGRAWTRGMQGVEFMGRLFGEDRRKAKLRIAKGQKLDESGFAATTALPSAPGAPLGSGRTATGEYAAIRPGTPSLATPTSRPPTSPSGVNVRPPTSPSGVNKTPVPPSIAPALSPPQRPSYPALPSVPSVAPALSPPAAPAVSPGSGVPRRPSYVNLPVPPAVAPAPAAVVHSPPLDSVLPRRPSYPSLPVPGGVMAPQPAPSRPSNPSLPPLPGADVSPALAPFAAPPARPSSPSLPAPPPSPFASSDAQASEKHALFDMPSRPVEAPPPEVAAPEAPQPIVVSRVSQDLAKAAAAALLREQAAAMPPAQPLPPPRRSRAPLAVATLVVVLGGGGAAWWFLAGPGAEGTEVAKPPSPGPVATPQPGQDPDTVPAPQPVAPPPPAAGGLRFIGVPPGAKVTVDGTGVSDLSKEVSFPPGAHQVVVEAKYHLPWKSEVEVAAGKVLALDVVLKPKPGAPKGTLDLKCVPACSIIVDGRNTGKTSPAKLSVLAGEHTLLLTNLPKGLSRTMTVTVDPKSVVKLKIDLAK